MGRSKYGSKCPHDLLGTYSLEGLRTPHRTPLADEVSAQNRPKAEEVVLGVVVLKADSVNSKP